MEENICTPFFSPYISIPAFFLKKNASGELHVHVSNITFEETLMRVSQTYSIIIIIIILV